MPLRNYQIAPTSDPLILSAALNEILADISRRLNYITSSGKATNLSGQKIVNVAAGVDDSDGIRKDQVVTLADLASVFLATAQEITITYSPTAQTLTFGIDDPLIVSKGGTGLATLTDHGILLGSGVNAVTPLAAATNGQLPIGSNGADPVLATITGTANQITITNAAGSITLSLPQDIDTAATVQFGLVYENGTFAEIYVADASATQSIPTGATYTKCTLFTTNGQSNNCTADVANDKITITKAGKYRVSGSFHFISGTANVVWLGAAFLDGAEQTNIHWKRKAATSTDDGSTSFTGFVDVTSVPLDLDFRLRHDNGGAVDFELSYGNLNVEYIGDT